MKAVTHPWLGEWHRPSSQPGDDGQPSDDLLHAMITRASAPDFTGCSVFALNGGVWVFRHLVWLLDPLGLPCDLLSTPAGDDTLLAYALQRQRPFLDSLGLGGMVPARQPPASTDWLHVSVQISAQATGDGDGLSLDAWTTPQGLDLFIQRAKLRRREREDSWPADLRMTLRWQLRLTDLPVSQLRRLQPGALLRLGLRAERESFTQLIGAGRQISLVPSDDGTLWHITALDPLPLLNDPHPLISGDAMNPTTDPSDTHDDTGEGPDFDTYGDGDDDNTPQAHDDAQATFADAQADEDEGSGEHDSEETPALRALNDMPVPVSLLCGRVEVPLAELRTWGPGSELALSTSHLDEIELFCGQRLMARGRLLRLNEQLAVSITQVML